MWEKLKKDNFWFGVIIGIILPLIVFTIVYFIDDYLGYVKGARTVIKDATKYMIGVFSNLILFQIYMVSWKMDRTGRGLVAITLFWAVGYVVLFQLMDIKYFPWH